MSYRTWLVVAATTVLGCVVSIGGAEPTTPTSPKMPVATPMTVGSTPML